MTKYLRLSFVFWLLAFGCVKLWANDKEVRLASLEWPPYTGKSLPGQGASAAIAREAFKAMGYTLLIDFYPWTRAVNLVKHNSRFVGYFPEYYSPEIEKQYFYSDVIGSGVLGFAERENKPVVWNSLDDLAWLKIGVVQDYVNTEELDQKIAQKKLQSDVATNDLKNLLKLNGKRIDLAVVDQNVFNFLINTSPELASAKKQLRFNERILENKSLFVCFRKDPEGERLQKIFNEGLKKININAIMAVHLK